MMHWLYAWLSAYFVLILYFAAFGFVINVAFALFFEDCIWTARRHFLHNTVGCYMAACAYFLGALTIKGVHGVFSAIIIAHALPVYAIAVAGKFVQYATVKVFSHT